MYKSYIPYLQHILDECLYVQSVITGEMTQSMFLSNILLVLPVFPPFRFYIGKFRGGCFCDFLFTFLNTGRD